MFGRCVADKDCAPGFFCLENACQPSNNAGPPLDGGEQDVEIDEVPANGGAEAPLDEPDGDELDVETVEVLSSDADTTPDEGGSSSATDGSDGDEQDVFGASDAEATPDEAGADAQIVVAACGCSMPGHKTGEMYLAGGSLLVGLVRRRRRPVHQLQGQR